MLKKYRDPILPTMIRHKRKQTFYYKFFTFIMIIYDFINSYIVYPIIYIAKFGTRIIHDAPFLTYKVIRNSFNLDIKKKQISGAAIPNILDQTFSCGHTEAEHIVLRHNHEKMKLC